VTDRFIIELPFQTLLANVYNSMYPMKRGWYSQMLWVHLSNGIPFKLRPKVPWEKWSILIEREGKKKPDHGAIWSGAKPIPDILQPRSVHKLGLGIVKNDSPDCLIHWAAEHIQGPRKWTRVTIIRED